MKFYLFVFILLSTCTYAQKTSLNSEKLKLEDLHGEIKRLESELFVLNKNERNSISALSKMNRQILSYNKIIVKIKNEEKIKEMKIKEISDSIIIIERSIEKLKSEYARYIRWLYIYGSKEKLHLLLTSKSISQAYSRYKYLSFITKKNEDILNKMEVNRSLKYLLKNNYEKEIAEKNILIKQKQHEQHNLSMKKNEKVKLISQLKKDKNSIYAEIDLRQKAEIKIKDLIAKIEKEELERERKELENKVKNKDYKTLEKNIYKSFSNFNSMMGRLPWPVQSKKITRSFGENTNEQLNTVTLNYGIDIKVNGSENVHAVGDGLISAIEWIPGYGSVIIITHTGNYRTVYGHVTDLEVIEGSTVKAGQIIGKVNDSLEGNILHFEIWNKRVYQNPEDWLSRK